MKLFANYVKISFWTCYYMFMWLVRYFSVNIETEPKVPKFLRYRFLEATDRYLFSEEPNFYKKQNTESNRTKVPNDQGE